MFVMLKMRNKILIRLIWFEVWSLCCDRQDTAQCTVHTVHYILHLHLHLYTSYYTLSAVHCTPHIYTVCCTFITSHCTQSKVGWFGSQDVGAKMYIEICLDSSWKDLMKAAQGCEVLIDRHEECWNNLAQHLSSLAAAGRW